MTPDPNPPTWRYTSSSQEVVRSDGVLIARDVPPEFGHLLEAAPDLLLALQIIAELPVPEQDNFMSHNMRVIARTARKRATGR